MNNNANYSRINQIVENQNSFGICLTDKPSMDTIAAATALYMALTKLGKDVSIACSGQLPPDANLPASDKIQKKLGVGGDTLLISFPYTEGSIDKVSYHIEGENFNLLIQPRPGFEKLNPNQVKYDYSGGKVGVIITLDVPTLAALGEVYTSDEDQFKGKDIINIDRHLTNANFGSLNIVERQSSSTSEIIYNILKNLQVEMDRDIATNLYSGIVAATNNFTAFSVNASTFETCATLLKHGAVKKALPKAKMPFPAGRQPFAPQPNRFQQSQRPQRPQRQPMSSQSYAEPTQMSQMPHPAVNHAAAPFEDHMQNPTAQRMSENKEVKPQDFQEEAPNDWLKPKIFNGHDMSGE
ncbi:MAG TPA: DHH family phosphoesterase [Candidatus Nitrosocosmicus sp.]|nr:DHH family phosphoesterase [Candidatus Nitrosocosmicus sp.]